MSGPVLRHLADGREILYFVDGRHGANDVEPTPGAESPASDAAFPPDQRPLPERPSPGQLRFDQLAGEWVAVAAHRQSRTYLPPADECPLCPSHGDRLSEIPAHEYDVVVFENRFPSLGPVLGAVSADPQWGVVEPAVGRCEVVSFTSEHTGSFHTLPAPRIRTVIDAWAQRTAALSAMEGIAQVFVFENRGAQIGVTLHHPHGQIYAYPYVSPREGRLIERANAHFERTGRALAGDLLGAERADGRRVVSSGEHFTTFVPWAARWPLEVHLVAHRDIGRLDELTDAERDELVWIYQDLLTRVDGLYDTPTPYIAAWFQAPTDPDLARGWRLHLQLTSPRRSEDKLKFLAGSEAAMGAFINDTVPDDVADRLRALPGIDRADVLAELGNLTAEDQSA